MPCNSFKKHFDDSRWRLHTYHGDHSLIKGFFFYYYFKLFLNKWRNMRDSWMKYENKLNECRSGSAAKTLHKYVFYNNMQFLKNIVKKKEKLDQPPKTSTNTTTNEVDERMLNFMDKMENENESRSMSFFKSISPTVDSFSDADIVEFQFQVMSILRNIHNKNRNTNFNYDYPYNSSNVNVPSIDSAGQTSSFEFNTEVAPPNAYGYPTAATTSPSFNIRTDTQTSNYSATSSLNVLSPNGSSLDLDFAELN
ncbi:hypothetical protein ABMA28_003506 [Loxostege sticticalis]|uniref:Uncharacterized protein n=1 Tax=Loxostege sticticalis TaxID=481309 RepID=A0ABD0SYZ5_LOXSC